MARSWCIASFAIIVGSYDVSPPLLSCNGLCFPFEVILSDWVFKDLRTLDVCLACAYLWWEWDIHVIYLMYVLVINLRVQWLCELMHRGWHTFSSWLSGSNFGALFEVLYVGWLDEHDIMWCISYNHTPRILEVTLEYLGDIRGLVDLCLKVLCLYELYDRSNGNNSIMLFYYGLLNRSIRKNNFEVVSYPTIISSFVLRY